MSHKKFGPDRFSRFDVYWIQTNKQTDKQTDRQAKFIYRRDFRDHCAKFFHSIFSSWFLQAAALQSLLYLPFHLEYLNKTIFKTNDKIRP